MTLPTIAQQRALAYAPKPLALMSFLSSGYVVYHLLCKRPEKRERLYHRLVLAMNLAIMPLSFMYFLSTWPVPEETPNYVGAVGNIHTCTTSGFIVLMLGQTVPFYYGSLGLQSFMAIRNKFKEENYVWVEKWVHYVAWVIPCALAVIPAATENINPSGSGCWLSKAPRGCESDPDIPCERGEDISFVVHIVGMAQIFLYFVFPPAGVLAIFLHLKKVQNQVRTSRGMQLVRASVQNQILKNAAVQICLYLFSFWSTFVFNLIHAAYQILTGNIHYNLLIFANVIFASQGLVMVVVYFTLENIGWRCPMTYILQNKRTLPRKASNITVSDIRRSARIKAERGHYNVEQHEEAYTFHIFDGRPDEDSPWKIHFDECDDDSDGGTTNVPDDDCKSLPSVDLEEMKPDDCLSLPSIGHEEVKV